MLKTGTKEFILFLLLLWLWLPAGAQPAGYQGFSATVNGRYYQLYYTIHQSPHPAKRLSRRDYVTFHLQTSRENGQVLKSSFGKKPFVKEIFLDAPPYADLGFMQQMLLRLSVGDSASFAVQAGDLFGAMHRPRPEFIEPQEWLFYTFKILGKQIEEQVQNDRKQAFFEQKKVDEKQIAQYVSKNLPGAKKTYSGIWYTLEYQGEGAFAQVDDIVALRYTARFLDGKTFGSSDAEGELYEFPVGHGFSLLALDEIMLLLREGAKGTFVIPSYLAYGQDGRQGLVPPDTPILLEIEFIDTVVKKIIIENKGKILQEEEVKAKEKGMTREEYFEYIQKEMEKRKIKGIKFGEDG